MTTLKTQYVNQRKQHLLDEDRKFSYFLLHKWEFIKTKKQEMLEVKKAEYAQKKKKKTYLSLMQMH